MYVPTLFTCLLEVLVNKQYNEWNAPLREDTFVPEMLKQTVEKIDIYFTRPYTLIYNVPLEMEYLPHFVSIWSQFIRFPGCCMHAPGVFRQLWVV